jgi:hypothetical protein
MSTPETQFRKVRTHPLMIVAFLISDLGAAIPFGLDSGPRSSRILPVEWVFSALMAVVCLCLLARLVGWLRPHRDAWPLALSAGLWTTVACYAGFFLPGAIIRARLGYGLIFIGLALLNAFAYAREIQGEVKR